MLSDRVRLDEPMFGLLRSGSKCVRRKSKHAARRMGRGWRIKRGPAGWTGP